MSDYTVFCRQANNEGTTWIGYVEAPSAKKAMKKGLKACSKDWGGYPKNDIHVLGVAIGNVHIIEWKDIE